MKRELTLTDIAGYLPYGLKIQDGDQDIWTIRQLGNVDPCRDGDVGLISDDGHYEQYDYIDDIRPVLRPMSDLDKEITHKGETFVPIDRLRGIDGDIQFKYEKLYSVKGYCMHWITAIIDNLSEWMFDFRGLIDAGLAISVHDLKQNPYEK